METIQELFNQIAPFDNAVLNLLVFVPAVILLTTSLFSIIKNWKSTDKDKVDLSKAYKRTYTTEDYNKGVIK